MLRKTTDWRRRCCSFTIADKALQRESGDELSYTFGGCTVVRVGAARRLRRLSLGGSAAVARRAKPERLAVGEPEQVGLWVNVVRRETSKRSEKNNGFGFGWASMPGGCFEKRTCVLRLQNIHGGVEIRFSRYNKDGAKQPYA